MLRVPAKRKLDESVLSVAEGYRKNQKSDLKSQIYMCLIVMFAHSWQVKISWLPGSKLF